MFHNDISEKQLQPPQNGDQANRREGKTIIFYKMRKKKPAVATSYGGQACG
jgi:hypothetical protein